MLEKDEIKLDEDMFLPSRNTSKTKLARVRRYKQPRYVKYRYAQELVQIIGDIDENESV